MPTFPLDITNPVIALLIALAVVSGLSTALYFIRLLIKGTLHTDGEYQRMATAKDSQINDLLGQVITLTAALKASNDLLAALASRGTTSEHA